MPDETHERNARLWNPSFATDGSRAADRRQAVVGHQATFAIAPSLLTISSAIAYTSLVPHANEIGKERAGCNSRLTSRRKTRFVQEATE